MIITIKRELQPLSKEEAKYLLDNMNYRHRLYNKGVEIIRKIKENNPKQTLYQYDIDKLIYELYEKSSDNYDYYCKGIRTSVAEDLSMMMRKIYTNKKFYKDGIRRFKFHKFNKYYRSFGFNTKPILMKNGDINTRVKELTNNSITIRFSRSNYRTYFIKELSWNNSNHPYNFDIYDIKEIFFVYKNNKFYINLVCDVEFNNPYKNHDNRLNLAGIDLGERNPAMVYDGIDYKPIKFPDDKIANLDKRIARLKQILDRKQRGSNNYNKLLLKINKLYERQYNIRLDWRNKCSYGITNSFKTIIVDEFIVPIITKDSKEFNIKGKGRKNINRLVSSRGMYYFMERLKEQSMKYHCNYIKAEPNTTRTCSKCGYVNDHIPLSQKYLICDNCGAKIHRDKNASKNCYNQYREYYYVYI